MPRKIWTEEDVNFLREHIATQSFRDLALHFGVSISSIASKASKLGLSRKKLSGEMWSSVEDEILKRHFEYAPKGFLTKRLPNRTWPAIFQRGSKTLNLKRKSQDHISLNYEALSVWNEFSAYFIGFVLADGHVIKNNDTNESILQIELAEYDRDILEKFIVFLDYDGKVSVSNRKTVRLQIRNVKIIDDLIDKGIPTKNKTFTASFPSKLPNELLKHFIRGVFDGDGSVYIDSNAVAFQLLGTQSLLQEIKTKASNFFESVSLCDRSLSKNGANVFCLKLKGKKAEKLFDWLYDDASIYLQRKYEKYCQCKILRHTGNRVRTGRETQ